MAKVTKALVKRLVQKGVLPPPLPTQPEGGKSQRDESQRRPARYTVTLDCRPRSTYRAFQVIDGGRSTSKPTVPRGVNLKHEDDY